MEEGSAAHRELQPHPSGQVLSKEWAPADSQRGRASVVDTTKV